MKKMFCIIMTFLVTSSIAFADIIDVPHPNPRPRPRPVPIPNPEDDGEVVVIKLLLLVGIICLFMISINYFNQKRIKENS